MPSSGGLEVYVCHPRVHIDRSRAAMAKTSAYSHRLTPTWPNHRLTPTGMLRTHPALGIPVLDALEFLKAMAKPCAVAELVNLLCARYQGFIVLPGILSEDELRPIRAHQLTLRNDRDALPAHERDYHGGASSRRRECHSADIPLSITADTPTEGRRGGAAE